jgi:hypothetical protein
MRRTKNFKALRRAIGVAAAAVVVVSGVAFAVLQSQQDVLAGNTIETATANLQLSTDGVAYGNSHAGFDFSGLIPGGSAQPAAGYMVYLKNSGNAPLALKLAVSSTPSNPANVDLNKVNIILTPVSGTPQSFTLQSLMSAGNSGGAAITSPGQLFIGNTTHFTIQVSMAADAITGSGAALGSIDFAFSGQAVSN